MIDPNPEKDVDSVKLLLNINEDFSRSEISNNSENEQEIYTLAWFNTKREEAMQQ
jgi:hypothetical protein